jgi:glycosyltransferase involved in cell wall biosynthesis
LVRLYPKTRLVRPLVAWMLKQVLVPQIESLVRDFRPDVIHSIHIGLVYSSEIAQAAAHRQGIPFVWTPLPHIAGDGWRGPRFQRLYRSADRLIALTETERRWLIAQNAHEDAVVVLPVGPLVGGEPDPAEFRKRYGLGDGPVVLFLGQKLPYKGYRQLAEAGPHVWRRHPNTRFVFVGPRTPESTAFFAGMTDDRVVEIGAVDENEKSSALAACDIFCMPSTQESLGGVYLEAWTYGKPVIAACIPTSQEIVSQGTDGLLVAQDGAKIAQALLVLLDNPEQGRAMGAAGCQKVADGYDWERLTQQLLGVYRSLAKGKVE